jgi:hypothetical protein
MSLERVADLVRRAAVDGGVAHALRFNPEALRTPLGLSQAHMQALKSAAAFPLPGATAQPATARATPRVTALDVVTVGGATLLPPQGDGPPPGPDTQPIGLPVGPSPAQSPTRTPSPGSTQPSRAPVPGIPKPPVTSQPSPRPPIAPSPGLPVSRLPSPLRGPGFALSPMPVMRQSPAPTGATKQPASPSQTTTESGPATEPCGQPAPAPVILAAVPQPGGCNCQCCLSTLAVVASVTTTAQTAITGIVAIAQMRARA